ncbi:MAG: dihydropteroate synthase [Bacteroidia bacterium]|nr:dihydropteroate synthase [Bacteroidia bacterium]
MIVDKKTLNCKGRLLWIEDPVIMGILNITPDSFYSESRVMLPQQALDKALSMINDGASIIDIGGASSRPGAQEVSEQEEMDRVLPIIETISKVIPDSILSIDTYRSSVAKAAVNSGASIVNDISAGRIDENMYPAIAEMEVPYILMHMQGNPQSMQKNPTYQNVTLEVLDFFIEELGKLRALNVKDVILDPGFGFGKMTSHNYELMNGLHTFRFLECIVLAGISRKSMIHKALNIAPEESLNGTTALHMKALMEGAKILRVHDVKPAVEVINLYKLLEKHQPES